MPDLEVDTQALQACVRPLRALADAMAAASAPPSVPVPRWETSDAAAALANATRVRGRLLAADLTRAADQLSAVAHDYEATDERAAGRLRAVR